MTARMWWLVGLVVTAVITTIVARYGWVPVLVFAAIWAGVLTIAWNLRERS